jgi:LPXTG-site transpeptidase (sortase) family protein
MVQDNQPGNQHSPGSANDDKPARIPGKVLLFLGVYAAILMVIAAAGAYVFVYGVGGGDSGERVSAGLQPTEPTPEATLDTSRPAGEASGHLSSVGSGDRLVISRIGVNAPLTHRKVPSNGVMPNPEGADDIAYYDFSSFQRLGGAPGLGGNAVFAGHVDSGTKACKNGAQPPPCEAVLWDLNTLRLGDVIEVHVSGRVHRYEVTSNQPVPAATGPWEKIVSATAQETVTIITCGGDFNRETREYTNRQVVTARKVA